MQKLNLAFVVSGKVAATFISSSIAIIIVGILAYIRKDASGKMLPALVIPPAPAEGVQECCGTFIGVTLYGYAAWAILWVVLYLKLRHKEKAGSIKVWLIFFLISLAIATILIAATLKWSAPTAM